MSRRSRAPENGFALLIVLFALVLLALLVGAVVAIGRGQAQLAGNLRASAIAEAAADGAVQHAIFHLLDVSGGHWAADGSVHRVQLGGAMVDLRIESETGKVNPNTAPPSLLQALLQAVGVDGSRATAIAAAIVDWRSEEPQGSGARAAAYRAAGRDYGPPGEPLQSLDELGRVLGMTPTVLERLHPHLSLDLDQTPDPATADPVVAQALAVASGQSPQSEANADASVVRITATAFGPGHARFARGAVVQLDPTQPDQPFRVMDWTAIATDAPAHRRRRARRGTRSSSTLVSRIRKFQLRCFPNSKRTLRFEFR